MKTKPWMMLVAMMTGWINRQQQDALAYLKEENKILKHELLKATGRPQELLNLNLGQIDQFDIQIFKSDK